jgi:glycosyltransferase involved in cell wall biosynthesis
MKIWILTSETPSFNPGGIARYVDNFARYLAAGKNEVIVLCRGEEPSDEVVVPGYRLITFEPRYALLGPEVDDTIPAAEHPAFPYNCMDYWTALSFQYAQEVDQLIAQFGAPDVIESQEYCGIAYYLLQRKLKEVNFLTNVPVVLNLHSPDFIIRRVNEEPCYQFPEYWTGRMERFCILAADALICPSQYLADQVQALYPERSLNIQVFPLPFTDVSEHSEPVEVEPDSLLYLGRLEVRKGVIPFLEVCSQLWDRGIPFKLTLIGGDTPYTPRSCNVGDYLKKRHQRWIDAGHLVFPGFMPQSELLKVVRKASAVVIPSIWENFPNTCMEAMSLGKVVLASTHGGMAEMLGDDEVAGLLFSWSTPGAVEQQLLRVLNLSAEERTTMGKTARERIHNLCSPERVLNRRLDHFKQVIARPATRTVYPFTSVEKPEVCASGKTAQSLSVIIPFYNLGAYVREAFESVMQSTHKPMEVILVNDGSTDPESLRVLDALTAEYPAVLQVLSIENAGLANARNVGAAAAKGDYIAFVDADDAVTDGFFGRSIALMEQYGNVHFVYAWSQYFDHSHNVFPTWDTEFPFLLGHNMLIPLCVVRRDSFLKYGRNKRKMAYNFEDYESWISLVAAGCGGIAIPELLTRYRVRSNSMWQSSSRKQHLYLHQLIVEEHPELYQKYGPELFLLQNSNGPGQAWDHPAASSPYDYYTYKAEAGMREWQARYVEMERSRDLLWHQKGAEVKAKEFFHKRVQELEQQLSTLKAKASHE